MKRRRKPVLRVGNLILSDPQIKNGEAIIYRLRFEPTGQYYIGRTVRLRQRIFQHFAGILEIFEKNPEWTRKAWLPFYRLWADHIRRSQPDGKVDGNYLTGFISIDVLHVLPAAESIDLECQLIIDNLSNPLFVNSNVPTI